MPSFRSSRWRCSVRKSVLTQETFLVFQDVFKTSWRRLQCNTFRLLRRLQDVFKTSSRRICNTSSYNVFKTFSRRLEDVFARRIAIMSSRRLQNVLEDKKMLHWRRLEDVLKTSSVRFHQGECLLGRNFANSQENNCGKVSFLTKLQADATASDLFRVSSRFLVTSFQQKHEMKKGKYPDGVQIFIFLLEYRFVWRQRFQKKFGRW